MSEVASDVQAGHSFLVERHSTGTETNYMKTVTIIIELSALTAGQLVQDKQYEHFWTPMLVVTNTYKSSIKAPLLFMSSKSALANIWASASSVGTCW